MTSGQRSDLSWAPMPEPITPDQYAAARAYADRMARDNTEAAMFYAQLGIEAAS